MSNIISALRKPAVGILAVLALACLGLTACGGSSGSSTNVATTATAATSTTSAAATGATTSTNGSSTSSSSPQGNGTRPGAARFTAIRECLQKNGITLPKPGAGRPPGSSRLGLPKGVTPAHYAAAVKKCGGGRFGAGGAGFQRATSPVFRQALAKYGACLRQNGVNIPAPNTSGKGPIFSTKGINTSNPQFKAATAKCRSTLVGAFRRPPGANGGPGTGGAPPAGGQAQGGESSG